MIGAAAGVGAAVAQLADFAFGSGIAARGNDEVLPGSVDSLLHIAEYVVGIITNAYHAGAGEEIAIHRDGDFLLADETGVAAACVAVHAGENLALDILLVQWIAASIAFQYVPSHKIKLLAERFELFIAPVAPEIKIETDFSPVMLVKPLHAFAEQVVVVRRNDADNAAAQVRLLVNQLQGLCYLCMTAAPISVAAVCIVHGCRAIHGKPYEEIPLGHPVQPLAGEQSAIGGDAESQRNSAFLCPAFCILAAVLQQLPLHERLTAEKANVQPALGTQCFLQSDIDTPLSGFAAHGVLVLAAGVAIPAAQGAVMRKAQREL